MKNEKNSLWQVELAPWAGQAEHGMKFVGARRNGRGAWLAYEQLPYSVTAYLYLQKVGDCYVCADIHSEAEFDEIISRESPGDDCQLRKTERMPAGRPGFRFTCVPPQLPIPAASAGPEPERLEAFACGDGSHRGLDDWYEEKEAALRSALASGRDFTTGWYGSKHEIASACITRRGGEILCEASVSNDFDTSGSGAVTIPVRRGTKVERIIERIRAALSQAWEKAEDDQEANETVELWSVHDSKGRWVETYLRDIGSWPSDRPSGDNYHKWGWQGEGRVTKKARELFEDFVSSNRKRETIFQAGKFTFKRGD